MASLSHSPPPSSDAKNANNDNSGRSSRSGTIGGGADDDNEEGEPPYCRSNSFIVARPNNNTRLSSNSFGLQFMTAAVDVVSKDYEWIKGDGRQRRRRDSRLAGRRMVNVSSRFLVIATAVLAVLLGRCSADIISIVGMNHDNVEHSPIVLPVESHGVRGAGNSGAVDGISNSFQLETQLQTHDNDGGVLSNSKSCDYECCRMSFMDIMGEHDYSFSMQSESNQLRGKQWINSDARMLQSVDTEVNNNPNPCPSNGTGTDDEEVEDKSGGLPKSVQYILIIVLVLFSALFSGLTLGLMSLDPSGLEIVMANSDDPRMASAAKAIYPIRLNGNLLLCTLLLGNVGVNSLLSIIMADLSNGLVGFLVSTSVIVLFGEIAPQAFCSRYALQVGEKTVPIVKIVMFLLYPLTKPLSMVLNKVLGHELGITYSASEMAKLIEMHVQQGHFQSDTGAAMTGALRYRSVSVREAMTPLINTFMLSADERLGFDTVAKIFKTGYSRIPVYEVTKSNVIGLLFVKDLIFLDPEDEIPVKNFVQIFGRGLHIVWPDDKLGEVLKLLKSGRSHMALVRDVNDGDGTLDPYYEIKGIITLEDIIEIIIGDEIVDETDELIDVNNPDSLVQRSDMGMYIDGALSGRDNIDNDDSEAQVVSGGASDRFSSRGVDWEARLRLLDERLVDEHLSTDEVRAVAAHLKTNYAKAVELISDKQLKELLASVAVTELCPALSCATVEGDDDEEHCGVPTDHTELLYKRGVAADFCTVVLSGKVTVMSGADKFRSDVSNWGVLATRALTDASYVPDFTSWVVPNPNGTGGCRFVKLDRKSFFEAVDNTALEKTGHDSDVSPSVKRANAEFTATIKTLDSTPVLVKRKSTRDSVGPKDNSNRPPSQVDGDTPPSPNQSGKTPIDETSPQPNTQIPGDTSPPKSGYVMDKDQKEIHSRRSKLLKAFMRAKTNSSLDK